MALISDAWTPENDLLTAAMKLKRPIIADKHKPATQGQVGKTTMTLEECGGAITFIRFLHLGLHFQGHCLT